MFRAARAMGEVVRRTRDVRMLHRALQGLETGWRLYDEVSSMAGSFRQSFRQSVVVNTENSRSVASRPLAVVSESRGGEEWQELHLQLLVVPYAIGFGRPHGAPVRSDRAVGDVFEGCVV